MGKVSHFGNKSLKIDVKIFIEEMYSYSRKKAVSGEFTFVAIDEDKKPVQVLM